MTKVYLREKEEFVSVPINTDYLELIDQNVVAKWQKIINLVAEILNVKAGLIMRVTDEYMEVFLRSENQDNPYPNGSRDKLGLGLYCETVIGENKELFIKNALDSKTWKDNPDIELNMVSYLGLPIKNPDGSYFGTICALDDNTMNRSNKYTSLMEQFREAIEMDLKIICKNRRIEELTKIDELTGLYNRRYINEILQSAQEDVNRNLIHVSLAMIDLDHLKKVNDQKGHLAGDKVLKIFGSIVLDRIRKTDRAARYGGDEFILLCRGGDKEGLTVLLQDIKKRFEADPFIKEMGVTFSFGIASTLEQNQNIFELLKLADDYMYKQKKAEKKIKKKIT